MPPEAWPRKGPPRREDPLKNNSEDSSLKHQHERNSYSAGTPQPSKFLRRLHLVNPSLIAICMCCKRTRLPCLFWQNDGTRRGSGRSRGNKSTDLNYRV